MTFNPAPLIRLIGSRSFAVTVTLLAVAAIVIGAPGPAMPVVERGFGLPSPSGWIESPTWSLVASLAAYAVISAGIILVNRAYNILRGLRGGGLLFAALFMMLQGAAPGAARFSGGCLLAMAALLAIALLFSVYQSPAAPRRVFLVFAMIGAGALLQYGFIPYILVMMVGCIQMRVMNLRCIIAIVAGALTPLWVLWGSGLIELSAFSFPRLDYLFAPGQFVTTLFLAATTLVTIVAGLASGLLDMFRIYARNAITRARFGLMAITGMATGLLCMVDFSNIEFYIPLLNLTTAFFLALLYSLRPRNSMGAGTVAIALVTLLFAALYIWKIVARLM